MRGSTLTEEFVLNPDVEFGKTDLPILELSEPFECKLCYYKLIEPDFREIQNADHNIYTCHCEAQYFISSSNILTGEKHSSVTNNSIQTTLSAFT